MNGDHRRREHDALEPEPRHRSHPQEHAAAHRVRQPDERRRAIGQHDILHEAGEVALVLPEAADVALARVGQHALRAALAAPVHRRHRKSAPAQVGDDLEVFLDELGAAAEQADRAPPRRARRIPAREPELGPVVAAERSDRNAARNRILGKRHQLHGSPRWWPDSRRIIQRADHHDRGSMDEERRKSSESAFQPSVPIPKFAGVRREARERTSES